jgi:hypothetical protein
MKITKDSEPNWKKELGLILLNVLEVPKVSDSDG